MRMTSSSKLDCLKRSLELLARNDSCLSTINDEDEFGNKKKVTLKLKTSAFNSIERLQTHKARGLNHTAEEISVEDQDSLGHLERSTLNLTTL